MAERKRQPGTGLLLLAVGLLALDHLAPTLALDERLRTLGAALSWPVRDLLLSQTPGGARTATSSSSGGAVVRRALWQRERLENAPRGDLARAGAAVRIFADVTFKDTERSLWRIEAGASEGVRGGDFATCRDHLIGRVEEVFSHHAWVRLLTARGQRFPVEFEAEDGTRGHATAVAGAWRLSSGGSAAFLLQHPTRDPRGAVPGGRVLFSSGPARYREVVAQWERVDAEGELRARQNECAVGFCVGAVLADRGFRERWFCNQALDLESVQGVHVLCPDAPPAGPRAGPPATLVLTSALGDRTDASGRRLSLGLALGRAQGLQPGAGVCAGGRLIGLTEALSAWTSRIRLLVEPQTRLESVLWFDDDSILYPGELISRGRVGGRLCLESRQPLPPTASGRLFAGAGTYPALRGALVGPFRVAADGHRILLAYPRLSELGEVQVMLAGEG